MNATPDPQRQLSSLALAVLLLGPDLTIHEANPFAEQMLRNSARRMKGRPLDELLSFSELRLNDWLRQGDAQLSAHSVEITTAGRPPFCVDMTLAPIADSPGWQVLTMSEIGATEGLEEYRQISAKTPAIIAHEIKNPLSAIRGAAQLLGRNADATEQGLTTLITGEVDRIAKLVDRMQSLGREQPEPVSECNLHESIRHALSVVEAAGDDSVKIIEEFDPSLPKVLGNPDGLVQILINLLSNAQEACQTRDDARIFVRTRFVSGFVMNAIRLGRPIRLPIEVRVSDNGEGVDPELRNHIFEPFVTSKKQGQGLGLALVKKLVRDMDGRITHERDEAAGLTHFSIQLPMAKPQKANGVT